MPPPPSRFGRAGTGIAVGAGVTAIIVVGILCVAAVLYRPHVMRVPGASMLPGVRPGEHVLVVEAMGEVRRGDVVVMRSSASGRDYLHRVVVLPGEVFDIADGQVRIAGRPLAEPYVAADRRSHETIGPFTMPAGHYYLLGDNRADALDSRIEGTVQRSQIWARRVW